MKLEDTEKTEGNALEMVVILGLLLILLIMISGMFN